MLGLLEGLWHATKPSRRKLWLTTLLLMLFAAAAELASLHALQQFLRLGTPNPGPMAPIASSFPLGRAAGNPFADAALVFIAWSITALLARLIILRLQDKVVLGFAGDASVQIFERAMQQPLAEHLRRETGELFAALENTQLLVNGALGPLLQSAVHFVIAASLLVYLVMLAPVVVVPFLAILGLVYVLVGHFTGARLRAGSQTLVELSVARMKAVQEAQNGFRDILISHAQQRVVEDFTKLELSYRWRQAADRFAAWTPRYLIEMVMLFLMGATGYYWAIRQEGLQTILPVAGALALGTLRLMPLVNSCFTNWGRFQANSAIIEDVLRLMNRPTVPAIRWPLEPIAFQHRIVLENIALQHPGREPVLQGVNLEITKGARIGLVGSTGSGKSSLLDVICCLIAPSAGRVRVDDLPLDSHERRAAWQQHIAVVPQSIYLPDKTIRDIIVFPTRFDEIDGDRLRDAIRAAELHNFIALLPAGLDTRIGDSGALLSGGQRQRLSIARALYRNADVLILDEATGQLDVETEQAVLTAFDKIDREITVLIVAHRMSALRYCDRIFELKNGRLRPIQAKDRV